MNPQRSFLQMLIVPFLIGLLFLSAYGVYKKNPYIMNPEPYLPHLTSGASVEPLGLTTLLTENTPEKKTAIAKDIRLTHRLTPLKKSLPETASDAEKNEAAPVVLTLDKKQTQFIADHGQIITSDANEIKATSDKGEELFQFQVQNDRKISEGLPVVTPQYIVFSTEDGRLYAIDRNKGNPAWIKIRKEPMHYAPILWQNETSEKILVLVDGKKTQTFHLLIFNVADGNFEKEIGPFDAGLVGKPIVTSDGFFYYTTTNGRVLALNLNDGKVAWKSENAASYLASPTVSGNAIYAASEDGLVLAFDRIKGKKLWELPLETQFSTSLQLIDAIGIGTLADVNGYIYAFDMRTGKRLWRYNTTVKSSGNTLTAYRMDQTTFKVVSFQSEVRGWTLWASCAQGKLCVFDPKQGILLHRIDVDGNLISAPQWSNNSETLWVPTSGASGMVLRGFELYKPKEKPNESLDKGATET